MKKQMYAMLDHTAQNFLNPLTFINDADAIRWFTTVVNDEQQNTNVSKYPEQFTLYRMMDYDDKTGLFESRSQEKGELAMLPKQIITGIQVQNTETQKHSLKDILNIIKDEMRKENIIPISAGGKK